MDLNNRIIWVFREPRSGGTWFMHTITQILNRKSNFVTSYNSAELLKNRNQEQEDFNSILNTHNFVGLNYLKKYTNPMLIRISRKNIVDQFLSGIIARKYNFKNFNEQTINNFPLIEREVVPKKEIKEFIIQKISNNNYWDTHSISYENETIFYEDLVNGFDSKLLGVKGIKMFSDSTSPTIKLPYNKREIFLNYDEIENIISEHLPNK